MLTSDREQWLSIRQRLPDRRIEIPYNRHFTAAEADRLRAGFWPQGTDDRWVIELDGEGLQMWRSWTGYCVYRSPVRIKGKDIEAGPLFVNDDPNQHQRSGDDYDIETVETLIALVLKKS